jgi:AcrR family transcriptional regulator
MPRTKKQNADIKEATIAKIKDAGLKLFATKGLSATSIVDISELAGVSTGLMYHYYKSKEDLYAELVMFAIASANATVMEIAEMPLSPAEKIMRLAKTMLDSIRKNEIVSHFYVLMPQVFLNKVIPKKAKQSLKESFLPIEIIKKIIIAGQRKGEIKKGNPDVLSSFFFSSITGLCTYKLVMGKQFTVPRVDLVTAILLNK